MSSPSVAAIVLSYDGRDVTLQALESLTALAHEPLQLVVVDNGSVDGTREAVEAGFPGVVVVRSEENLGPAGGVNLGLRWALVRGFDYYLVLNNDIEVAPDMVGEMLIVAERDPEIGIVGPKAYYYEDRNRIWAAGDLIQFRESVTKPRGHREIDRGQYDRTEEVPYVNGCAMLIHRRVLEDVGLWDPIYFLSVEDADFCMRAKRAGYSCWYAPRARLWHMVSVTAGGYRPGRTYHTGRSTALFLRRYATLWQWVTATAFTLAALPVAFLRELPRGNQRAVIAKARGFRDGLREPMTAPPTAPNVEAGTSGGNG
ncbi:MAG: glycosyltransferase family 2 protein [Thermoanaerobaculia bacterium]|nr:glycosyltransferase family 2 protein [Thermoanaerobaculia bacterium]